MTSERVGGAARARGGERPRPLHELQPALLPARPRGPRACRGRRARRGVERPRRLPPGLAPLPDRLELAARAGQGRRAACDRRHRLALDGHGAVRQRAAHRRALRRSRHDDPRAPAAARRGRDVLERGGRRARGRADVDRGHRSRARPLRRRRAGRVQGLAGQRRAQELPALRGGRLGGGAGLERGAPRGAVARTPRRAERRAAAQRGADAAGRGGAHVPPGRSRRGLGRDVPRALPRRLHRGRRRAARRRRPTTRRSPTGTAPTCWETRSRCRTAERRWVEVPR